MRNVFVPTALACPRAISQLACHVFRNFTNRVQRNLFKCGFKTGIATDSIAQPTKSIYEARDRLFAFTPEWPVGIIIGPPETMMSIAGCPSDAIVSSGFWRKPSFFASFFVTSGGKFWEKSFQMRTLHC